MRSMPKAMVSWSSGKDAAFAWLETSRLGLADVVGVFTTVGEMDGRVPIHEVDARLLAQQVDALGLPHVAIPLPDPCPNAIYEERLRDAFARLRAEGVTHVVFGDLFLDDIRAYRDRLLAASGMTGVYPLWRRDTADVARSIVASGIEARVIAVDPARLDASFVGRTYDAALLEGLPHGVDPCGERGEFHTFVEAGPMMRWSVGPAFPHRQARVTTFRPS
jgi:uncharacterized protein (TIGR00290 family)